MAAVDLWTGVHAVSGYLLGDRLGGSRFAPPLTALVVWEVLKPEFWPGWHETTANQAVDVLAGGGGWVVTR